MFLKLPANTKVLLDEILSSDNAETMLHERLERATFKDKAILRKRIGELESSGFIAVLWAGDTVYKLTIKGSAYTYEEDLAEHEQERQGTSKATYNINATQANVAFDNATINSLHPDDERGGD
jgi:DUF1009 family protein